MKTGRTHLGKHDALDYAVVFDDGTVGLFLRNSDAKLAPNLEVAHAAYGQLVPYHRGMPIVHRPKQSLPEEITVSEQGMALLGVLDLAPKPEPKPDPHEDPFLELVTRARLAKGKERHALEKEISKAWDDMPPERREAIEGELKKIEAPDDEKTPPDGS